MTQAPDPSDKANRHDLSRFLIAQEPIYNKVLSELRSGQKRSHWMWFIFPQLDGLGFSITAKRYSIRSLEESRQYLEHPILGARLLECTQAVLGLEGRSISEIFGYPDHLKFKSSMTLFSLVDVQDSGFGLALEKYFDGERDDKTLDLLDRLLAHWEAENKMPT